MSERLLNILVPIVSIIIGIIAGAIVMLVSGYNPVDGYIALWNGIFGDMWTIGNSIRTITPYILSGLAVAFAFRTGLFNIGVEGQLLMGWLASVYVGYAFDLPRIIHLPVALLAAAVAGAFWAFLVGYLKARFSVHEVIGSIMLNYTALYVTNAIISNISDGGYKTPTVLESATLRNGWLREVTSNSSMHLGIIVAIIMVIVMWFLLQKTTLGYELKSVGFNQNAAKYAGMNVKKNVILAMTISGVFAGLAGAMEGLGTFQNASMKSAFSGIGFDGIAVALLGANTPLGVVFGATLFGSLKFGAIEMQSIAGIPTEIVSIIIALIIFFVASGYIIRVVIQKFAKKKEEI